jgi:sec-independent protein translocase protein TatA
VSLGPFQILIVLLVLLVLFGRGRISAFMGDFGKGVKNFRQGLGEDNPVGAPRRIEGAAHEAGAAAEAAERHPAAD